jgi:methyltransferase (TIGR00027 family)
VESKRGAAKDMDSDAIPFTARLIAHHRAVETQRESPLIVDPFAARLAGDLSGELGGHSASRGDYSIVRAYFVEREVLGPWCEARKTSQVVMVGAGLDTRAYRLEPLANGKHTVFEIDFSSVIQYKERMLADERPLCRLVRVAADLEDGGWLEPLIAAGYSSNIPTLWIMEGLAYYLQKDTARSLLRDAAGASARGSQIFADLCVPILAEVRFGAFLRHFKWGLEKYDVAAFFASVGWDVLCDYADAHDQGRDVGQRGLMFAYGTRA